ncbi:speckle-type POZ protein-like [Leptopilina heterotoma]|uniref:speckle-type POZ protein-like n=1 Tax=Leptopilina heterotoma TaxID=63436 RepID=UPI001CA9E3C0|nr:speckle-type POZ protein-like [Leptopilina heterotoma]
MGDGMNLSNAFGQIVESLDVFKNKNINYVALIIPLEKIRKSMPNRFELCQGNPGIDFHLIRDEIHDNKFSCSIEFLQTLPNKHYEITLYQLNAEGEIIINDTINLANITQSTNYKFNKQFSWVSEWCVNSHIYMLCKIQEVKSSAKIDIPKNEMSAKILSLYEEKELTDFKIICKDKEFCVHKMILVCQSDVFRAMFENPMKESREDALIISDFEPKIVEAMIRYLYTDEMTESLSEDEFKQLLLIANKYNLEKLESICFNEILKEIVTFKQAADLILFTGSHNFIDLTNFVVEFMKENKNVLS